MLQFPQISTTGKCTKTQKHTFPRRFLKQLRIPVNRVLVPGRLCPLHFCYCFFKYKREHLQN